MPDQEPSVLVNGNPRVVPANCTVSRLIDSLGLDGRHIAIAINRDVIPRSAFATHSLTAGDHIEILEAVGGG